MPPESGDWCGQSDGVITNFIFLSSSQQSDLINFLNSL
jgi:hypothetical protein